jgi:hypothetical protein
MDQKNTRIDTKRCQNMWGYMGLNCDATAVDYLPCCEEWRCEECFKQANLSNRNCVYCGSHQYTDICDICYTAEQMSGEADRMCTDECQFTRGKKKMFCEQELCKERATGWTPCCQEWLCAQHFKEANISHITCDGCKKVMVPNQCTDCVKYWIDSENVSCCSNCSLLKKKLKEMEIK